MKPVIERVEKLLRLASVKSGTTQGERDSAALEVVRLIEAHDLIIRERKAKKSERRKPVSREWSGTVQETWAAEHEPPQRPPGSWIQSIARASCVCCDPDCGEPIEIGEHVWMRIHHFRTEFLHVDGPCGW